MSRAVKTLLLIAVAATGGWCQESVSPPLPAPVEETPEQDVLARGPVHEAFAEQISPDPAPGMVVPAAPPEDVNEVPPDLRPEGDDIVWVPGYWFWDDERQDYLWVSGVWRRPPPGRRWVPGYWQKVATGYQWIAGFWSADSAAEVEYLESPPATLESGPSSPAPSADYFWIPGSWVWGQTQYHWRPGSWCGYRDGWTWVAPRYVWTPRGCVFVSGYWDYTLTGRGYLFAPVYFHSPIYRRVGYLHRPVCWIGYEPLLLHLFVRPHCHHLYFGDYYAASYRDLRYTPCYAFHNRYRGYASLYVYYQHHYRRHGIDYCGRVRDWHQHYTLHADLRPARTYHTQLLRPHVGLADIHRRHNELARPYNAQLIDRVTRRPLVPLSSAHRDLQLRHISELRDVGRRRRSFEVATINSPRLERRSGESVINSRGRLVLPDLTRTERLVRTEAGGGLKIPNDVLEANRRGTFGAPLVRGQDTDAGTRSLTDTLSSRLPTARRSAADDARSQPRLPRAAVGEQSNSSGTVSSQLERIVRRRNLLRNADSGVEHTLVPQNLLTSPRSSQAAPDVSTGSASGPSLAEQIRSRLRSAAPSSDAGATDPTNSRLSHPPRATTRQPAAQWNSNALPRARSSGPARTELPNGSSVAPRVSPSPSQLGDRLRGRLREMNVATPPTARASTQRATGKANSASRGTPGRLSLPGANARRSQGGEAPTVKTLPTLPRSSASRSASRSAPPSSLGAIRSRMGQGSRSSGSVITRRGAGSTSGGGSSSSSLPRGRRLGANRGGGN